MDQMNASHVPYAYAPPNPIAGPAKVFGIIYAVLAGLTLLSIFGIGAIASVIAHGARAQGVPPNAPGILLAMITVVCIAAGVLNALTAYGLLAVKSWGRTLLIVTSILSLISIPVGTILGGFALYYFLRDGSKQDYERLVLENL